MKFIQTAYAWSFVFSLLFTIWLVWKVLHKWREEEVRKSGKNQGMGYISAGFLALILGTMNFLFFPFATLFVETNYQFISLPKYDASIVAVESQLEEQSYTDRDNRTRKRNVRMYTSIVEFTDAQGINVRLPGSVRSGEEPVIGDKLRVAYAAGMSTALEISFRALALQFGLLVMLLVLGFCLLLTVRWALGKNNDKLMTLGMGALMKVGIPLVMIGMEAGLIYVLVRHFSGVEDLPIWAVALIIFFGLLLALSIIGYLISLLRGSRQDKLPQNRNDQKNS
jgi:hypothetical protein